MSTYNEEAINNFPGTKMIVSVSAANLIAKSFKLKSDLINHLGLGIIKAFEINKKHVYVDINLKSDDYNIYNEFYSPLITVKK
jgi:hypothetical protein